MPVLRSKRDMRGGHGERRSRYQPVNGSATDRQTVALPIEERSRYLIPQRSRYRPPKGSTTLLPEDDRVVVSRGDAENAEENMRGLSQPVPFNAKKARYGRGTALVIN